MNWIRVIEEFKNSDDKLNEEYILDITPEIMLEILIDLVLNEDDDALHEKYMFMIPVVEVNSKVIQYGQLDYVTLLKALSK